LAKASQVLTLVQHRSHAWWIRWCPVMRWTVATERVARPL
jgi:hypothetical protein